MVESKKSAKAQNKLEKKRAKAEIKRAKRGITPAGDPAAAPSAPAGPSPAVRYAEAVRGALYVVTGGSLLVALVLGQRGAIVSFDDLVESLFVARAGKVVLGLVGVALLIYGMKHLRIVR